MMVKAEDSQPRGCEFKSFTIKTIILAQFSLHQSATLKLCTTLTWHSCMFWKPTNGNMYIGDGQYMKSRWYRMDCKLVSWPRSKNHIKTNWINIFHNQYCLPCSISECGKRAKKIKANVLLRCQLRFNIRSVKLA